MTDQVLNPTATTIGTTIAGPKPAPISRIAKIRKRFTRAFWRMTEDYAKQAKPSSFKGAL